MWNKDTCPICDKLLTPYGTKENFSKVYSKEVLYQCATSVLTVVKGSFKLESHFKKTVRDNKPWFEVFFIHPFMIESYYDVSNIYTYEKDRDGKHFIVETPYLNLPWKDKDAVIRKLKLYTVFS